MIVRTSWNLTAIVIFFLFGINNITGLVSREVAL